jgi:hypothetical protein
MLQAHVGLRLSIEENRQPTPELKRKSLAGAGLGQNGCDPNAELKQGPVQIDVKRRSLGIGCGPKSLDSSMNDELYVEWADVRTDDPNIVKASKPDPSFS